MTYDVVILNAVKNDKLEAFFCCFSYLGVLASWRLGGSKINCGAPAIRTAARPKAT